MKNPSRVNIDIPGRAVKMTDAPDPNMANCNVDNCEKLSKKIVNEACISNEYRKSYSILHFIRYIRGFHVFGNPPLHRRQARKFFC